MFFLSRQGPAVIILRKLRIAGLRFPFSRFIVDEESMLPIYKPGDHVLTFNWTRAKIGDVVVFELGGKNYIKRVVRILGDSAQVEGDNKNWSSKISPITLRQIVGKVILKY